MKAPPNPKISWNFMLGFSCELIACGCSRRRTPSRSRSDGKTFVARCNPNGNLRTAIRPFVAGARDLRLPRLLAGPRQERSLPPIPERKFRENFFARFGLS